MLLSPVCAYEVASHAAMTREALMQCQLNPTSPSLFVQLGIAGKNPSLGNTYFDIGPDGSSTERVLDPMETKGRGFGPRKIKEANLKSSFQPEPDSLPGWLMLGAIREDDVPFDEGAVENNPQDDPDGPLTRVLSHFFDPYDDRALTVTTQLGAKAPDWATGTGNHFSVIKAREAMWRALTLKYFLQIGTDLPFTPSASVPTKEALQTAYWATTFRTLGDVVHLLQDMAQPQHTRNDPHSGLYCPSVGSCYGGHASFYEHYVDAKVKGKDTFVLRERFLQSSDPRDATVDVSIGPPNYGSYPIPRFADYRSYFTTATGIASLAGKGLANYSNQGFYSAGTNISSGTGYPSPPQNGQGLTDVTLSNGTVRDTANQPVAGTLIFKTGGVVDATNPTLTAPAIRLSSLGMFDQFMAAQARQYTLNHYNYDDQMALLLPRAIAYSAGLLDFFFRGRMEISLPDEGVYGIVDHAQFEPPNPGVDPYSDFKGFSRIRLRALNSTPSIITPDSTNVPQKMPGGTVVAVLKFHRNLCYRNALDGEITTPLQMPICRAPDEEIVVSDLLANQEIPATDKSPNGVELPFKFQKALPINAVDIVLQVVYRGPLGNESDAVVVATKDIPEPTFITTYNDTDRVLVGGRCYDPAIVANTDTLWNQLAQVCKPPAGAQRYVTNACANLPLNVRLSTGSAIAPVAVTMEKNGTVDQRILPRRFARFAVLGDPSVPTSMVLGFNNTPLSLAAGTSTQPQYSGRRVQQQSVATLVKNATDTGYHYQVDTSTVVDSYVTHRGIRTWKGQSFVVDGTTGTVGAPCPEADLDNLQINERYPLSATIIGWN
jgi:hypothetical protein